MEGFERFSAGSGETRLRGFVRAGHPEYAQAALCLDSSETILCKDRPKIKAGIAGGFFVKRYNLPDAAARFRRLFRPGGRPLHCLHAAEAVEKAGVYTPQGLAALSASYQGHICDYLITEALSGTRQTVDCLIDEKNDAFSEWEKIADAAFQLIAHLHDAGIEHGDLNLRNLCATRDLAQWGVIDLDGTVLHRHTLALPLRGKEAARFASGFLRFFPQEKRELYAEDAVRRYQKFSGARLNAGHVLARINYLLDRKKA